MSDGKRGGSIVDACRLLLRLTVGQTYGAVRRALGDPPAPLAIASQAGGTAPTTPSIVPGVGRLVQGNRTEAGTLGPQGRAYLTEGRHLAAATVNAFAADLRENSRGNVRAPHNLEHQDGEERGLGWKSFVGSRQESEGGGPSLWLGRFAEKAGISYVIVAESFISGMSAWECLPPEQRSRAVVVSTAGNITAATARRLEEVLAQVAAQRTDHNQKVWLFNASDRGETNTARRADFLRAAATRAGLKYWAYYPPNGQDWNDELAVRKGLPRHEDAHSAIERHPTDTIVPYQLDDQPEALDGAQEQGTSLI